MHSRHFRDTIQPKVQEAVRSFPTRRLTMTQRRRHVADGKGPGRISPRALAWEPSRNSLHMLLSESAPAESSSVNALRHAFLLRVAGTNSCALQIHKQCISCCRQSFCSRRRAPFRSCTDRRPASGGCGGCVRPPCGSRHRTRSPRCDPAGNRG